MTSPARPAARDRLLLIFAMLAATVAAVLAAPAADAQAKRGGNANSGRDQIVSYWTPARMNNAVPRGRGKGKPGGDGGGDASYTRSVVSSPTVYPNSTNGKVFMTMGRTDYQCSGTAVQSDNDSLVWTAGHCVWDARTGGYAKNFMFVPAYDSGPVQFGEFTATAGGLRTTTEYEATESFAHDFGAARVGTNGSSQTLATAAGERSISFSPARDQAYTLYGYPADRKTGRGRVMYQCVTSWALDDASLTPPSIGVECNWPAGSSGGAWIGADGALATVTSYGYPQLRDNVFGSYQGDAAESLYDAVQG